MTAKNSTQPNNIKWHETLVSRSDREQLNGHRGAVLWFTGLSGAWKSTIANAVNHELFRLNKHTYLLDGDNVRHGLNNNLGFSEQDRRENIRRIGEVSKLMVDAGLLVCSAFVSPYRKDRDAVRALLGPGEFIEIYVQASLKTCEARDPKGLYKKARAGEIKGFTGIDDPYETPTDAEIVLDSDTKDVPVLTTEVVKYLDDHQVISAIPTK